MIDVNKKLFRWGPLDAAVLPLGYTLEASFDMMHELFGVCWPESLVIFDRDKALWILESDSVAEASDAFTEKIIIPKDENKKFNNLWETRVANLQDVQNELANIDLSIFNNQELSKLFFAWSRSYLNFWAVGMTAELVNYSLESKLKSLLKEKYADERDINESFALLSTPTKLSFYKEEETDLMRIVLLDGLEKSERLLEHQRSYFWMYNNYLDTKELDKKYFEDQIKNESPEDARKFLNEFKNYKINVAHQKKELIGKLKFSNEEEIIVELLNDSIIFQDDRKKYNLIASYYLDKFLAEFSRRLSIPVRDLKWLLPDEVEKVMEAGDLAELIEQRKHLMAVSRSLGNKEIEVRDMASKKERLYNSAEFEKSVNLQGTVASIGNARYFRGIAKIILSPRDGHDLKPGEILVTTMTTPDFVVFMKKAGAIITDVGGVTCHAAIVSREFGVPCIVGTENATKLIKDGDILELHNLRGTIKITSP